MSDFRGIDLVQEFDRISWNKRTGFTIGRPFRGSQTKIEQAKLAALTAGDAFDLNPGRDGEEWEIVIYFGAEETQSTSEPLSDNWEIVINGLEKELWEIPHVRVGFQQIYDSVTSAVDEETAIECVNWIRKNIELYIQGGTDRVKDLGGTSFDLTFKNLVNNITTTGFDKASVSVWLKLITRLYARGVKAFPISQYVLKRTRVLAANFDFQNIAHVSDDIFKRRTTESLQSHEPIPDKYKKLMPPGQWVKNSASVKQQSATKDELTEEWWHADVWEPEIYGDLI